MSSSFERFYILVRRIVGLTLMLLFLVILGLFLKASYDVAGYSKQARTQQKLTQVAGADLSTEELRLTDFNVMAGSKFLYASLQPTASFAGSLSSVNYIKSNSRNILFFNTVDKKAHWLFPNNDQVIVNVRFITYPAGGVRLSSDSTQQKVTTSILIASEDRAPLAAGSKRLQNLFIALSDDYKLTPVVEGIDSILGHHQTSENNLLIFYLTNGAAKVIDYDLAARKVTSDTLLTAQ